MLSDDRHKVIRTSTQGRHHWTYARSTEWTLVSPSVPGLWTQSLSPRVSSRSPWPAVWSWGKRGAGRELHSVKERATPTISTAHQAQSPVDAERGGLSKEATATPPKASAKNRARKPKSTHAQPSKLMSQRCPPGPARFSSLGRGQTRAGGGKQGREAGAPRQTRHQSQRSTLCKKRQLCSLSPFPAGFHSFSRERRQEAQ